MYGLDAWAHRERERLDTLKGLLAFAVGARVLDLGCYRGLVGYEFARHGAMLIHGIDVNKRGLETARNLFEDVCCDSEFFEFDLSCGQPLPLGNQEYDITLMLGVYHKLRRDMDQVALDNLIQQAASRTVQFLAWNGFAEEFELINRVVKPLGCTVISQHNSPNLNTAIWQVGL